MMKNIVALLILLGTQTYSQDKTIIRGRIQNFNFSKISIQSDENPLTGTQDEFFAQLSDSGKFMIELAIYVPQFFRLYIDNKPVNQVFACPNSETVINIDSLSHKPEDTFSSIGWVQAMYDNYLSKRTSLYFDKELKKDSLQKVIPYVIGLQKENIIALNELRTKYKLNDCQSGYAKGVLDYMDYLMVWTEICRKYPFNDEVYKCMNWLPLNDTNSLQSLEHQRALMVFVQYKVYLENGWNTIEKIKSIDPSIDEYQVKFHDKVLSEIKNVKVRNIMLTRQTCNLLYIGSTAAELIYPKYQKNCSDPYLKQISAKYHNAYLKNRKLPKPQIDTLKRPLFEKLKKYKGKVLYIDFWASGCSPCMHGLPFTKEIKKKYAKAPFEVVYVNVYDDLGTFETFVKRLDLKGALFHLNKKENEDVFKLLNFRGIPQYVLIDKDGIIVEKKAPHPDDKLVYEKIDHLLNKL